MLLKVFAWVKQYLRFCVFFLILKSRRKKIKIRLQNLVQTKQKNLRVLHFFGVFCDPSSTFPSKTGKLQGSPEGVKRSQFFEPVVMMGLVPPGQSCTESFWRILGVEMVTGGKVGKCNDRDDCQKNLGFFCWGGGGVPSSDVNVPSSDVKSPLFNRWVYEKAQLIGMANFQCVSFFQGYPEIACQIDFSGRSFILSMNSFLKKTKNISKKTPK